MSQNWNFLRDEMGWGEGGFKPKLPSLEGYGHFLEEHIQESLKM